MTVTSATEHALMNTSQLARRLGVSRQTIFRWRRDRLLPEPAYSHGSITLWDAGEIIADEIILPQRTTMRYTRRLQPLGVTRYSSSSLSLAPSPQLSTLER